MKITALALLPFSFLMACSVGAPEPKLPNTPETVVQLWQESIDKNKFELARRLSAGDALTYINELAALNNGDTLEWENNAMLNLRCVVAGDSAHCTYHFEDETGEPMPGQLALRRVKNQWLVAKTDFEDDALDSLRNGADLIFPDDEKE